MFEVFKSLKKTIFLTMFLIVVIVCRPWLGVLSLIVPVVVFAVGLCFIDTFEYYIVLFALLPYAYIFKNDLHSSSYYTICEFLLFTFLIIDIYKKKVGLNKDFLFAVSIFFVYLVFFSVNELSDFSFVIKCIVRLFLMYSFFYYEVETSRRQTILIGMLIAFLMGMLLMLVLSFIQPYMDSLDRVIGFSSIQYTDGADKLQRRRGLMDDPNYFAIAIIISLSLLTCLYYDKKVGKLGFWTIFIPIFLMGFATYSKSYFLCAFAYIIFLLLFVLLPKYKIQALLLLCIMFLVILAVINGQIPVFQHILKRFTSGDITTGRSALNEKYLSYILNNPKVLLFGRGLNAERLPAAMGELLDYNVHNLYVEFLYRLGVVGTLINIYAIVKSIKSNNKGAEFVIVKYIPLLFMFIMYFALAGVARPDVVYYFIICYSYADQFCIVEKKSKSLLKVYTMGHYVKS